MLLGLAWMFVTVGSIALHIAAPTESLRGGHLLALAGGWTFSWASTYAILRKKRPEADLMLLPPVALLTGWGLLLLARLAPGFLPRQIVWLFVGCVALTGVALQTPLLRLLQRYRYTLLAGGLLLLAATLVFGVNPSGYGAQLWLGFAGLYFQPSEILKLLLVVYLASYLAARGELLNTRHGKGAWPAVFGPMLLMIGLALVLLAWQQDLGAALLFYLTALAMLYLAWGKLSHVIIGLLMFAPVAVAGALISDRVALRVSIWLDPWAPAQADRAFQILQSLFALSAGGLFGEGLGQGRPTLIPAVHTDFIYAALADEFGITGAIALIGLISYFVFHILQMAQERQNTFESLLAGGIAALLGIQAWVIIAGNAKLIPITGVTLPFLSYGGSSLTTMMIATGILLNMTAPHPPPLSLRINAPQMPALKGPSFSRLGASLFLLLGLTAIGTGTWSILRADEVREYPTNPHRILDELRVRRGRILDRRGVVLADISIDENGFVERTYPAPEAAPVIGFATLEYGTEGMEAACDATLRGDTGQTSWEHAVATLLHRDPQGNSVQLTLDARLQIEAQNNLAGHAGAVLLADTHTGEILALASAPTFDPATVAAEWDTLRDAPQAPLLNRATQALLQPGGALETLIADAALTARITTPPTPLNAEVTINGAALNCRTPPEDSSWASALANACPAPFASAGQQLGQAALYETFETWGLTTPPELEIPTTAAEFPVGTTSAEQEAIGQGQLLVTPLHMLQVAVTLGNEGVLPPLHLLNTAQTGCTTAPLTDNRTILDPQRSRELRALWSPWSEAIGHLAIALAGEQREITWFMGLNARDIPRYAVVVVLENAGDPENAAEIGVQLLRHATNR
ncbi:MAG: FtsW/RodA/SpoVE family cell cycle protein [Anaerolineae bacterium]|nr:FtsW/RodA/SpoVE family cell cycle protein [Anaerolineae bacterium]